MVCLIQIKILESDKKIIEVASDLIGLPQSSFCRQASLKEARKILSENKIDSNEGI